MDRINDTGLLDKYFNDEVTIKKPHSRQMKVIVLPIVHAILSRIHQLDSRFGDPESTVHAGSAFQKLKVKKFDEFDFTVPVVTLQNLHWVYPEAIRSILAVLSLVQPIQTEPPEDVALQLTSNADLIQKHSDMMEGQSVIPSKTRNIFRQLVMQAISDLRYQGFVLVSAETQSPTGLTILLTRHSQPTVSVDLMVMCPIRVPFDTWVKWPRHNQFWPSHEKIREVKSKGISIVAKKDHAWTMTFVECEKVLMSGIDGPGEVPGVRKKCHRIMKGLLQEMWCFKEEGNILTSYHLKNLLFWECEKYPFWWHNGFLARRIHSMIKSLLQCLYQHKLQLYFYPDVNLFENRSHKKLLQVASRVERTFEALRRKYTPVLPSPTIQPYLRAIDYQTSTACKIVGSGVLYRSHEKVLQVAPSVERTFEALRKKYTPVLPSPTIQPYLRAIDYQTSNARKIVRSGNSSRVHAMPYQYGGYKKPEPYSGLPAPWSRNQWL